MRQSVLYDSRCTLLPYVRSNGRHLLDSADHCRRHATRLGLPRLICFEDIFWETTLLDYNTTRDNVDELRAVIDLGGD
eukprot:COSAG01_NODE_7776_length_3061_cov_11.754303_3_plen_78_part_00